LNPITIAVWQASILAAVAALDVESLKKQLKAIPCVEKVGVG